MAVVHTSSSGDKPIVAASKDKSQDAGETSIAARPENSFIYLGAGLSIAGLAIGLMFLHWKHGSLTTGLTHLPAIAKGTSAFAVLYVFAQAIERVLVPVSWFGGGFKYQQTKKQVKQKVQTAQVKLLKAGTVADRTQAAQNVADAQHAADQYSANLTATAFGVASLLAFIASGYSGALLLHVAGIDVDGWLDLVVTGLAVAGGTKPLHDLISNVSSASAGKS